MMFGYATNETEDYMPLPLWLAHRIVRTLAEIRHEGREMTYLRPDAKSQVTIEYADDGTPIRIDTIVVSTQHDDWVHLTDTPEETQEDTDSARQGSDYRPQNGSPVRRTLYTPRQSDGKVCDWRACW